MSYRFSTLRVTPLRISSWIALFSYTLLSVGVCSASVPMPADVSHYEKYLDRPGVAEAHTLMKSRIGPVADFVGADLTCTGPDGNWKAAIPFEYTKKGPAVAFQRHRANGPRVDTIDIVLLVDVATTFPRGISTGGTLIPAVFTVTDQDDDKLLLVGGDVYHTQEVRFAREGRKLKVDMIDKTPNGERTIADLVCSA